MVVLGGGFQGYLSQVFILDTKLSGPAYINYTKSSCLSEPLGNVQLDWYAYHLESGTRRVTPAHCDDDVLVTDKEGRVIVNT